MYRLTSLLVLTFFLPSTPPQRREPTSFPSIEPPIAYYGGHYSIDKPIPTLTEEQIQEVSRQAREACPPKQHVWFIWIRANSTFNGKRNVIGTAYFAPTKQEREIWKGQSVFVGNNTIAESIHEQMRKQLEKNGPRDVKLPRWTPPLSNYWFVAPREANWNMNELPIPNSADFPFAPPQGVSEAQTVQLINYVRDNATSIVSNASFGTELMLRGPGGPRDRLGPVYEIQTNGDAVEIRTGCLISSFGGCGIIIRLKKTEKSFEIVGVDQWYA